MNGSTTGVCWDKRAGMFRARITQNGKRVHLGRFHTEEDAAKAVEAALIPTATIKFGFPLVIRRTANGFLLTDDDGWMTHEDIQKCFVFSSIHELAMFVSCNFCK